MIRRDVALGMNTINEDSVVPKRVPVREREQQEAEILSDCESRFFYFLGEHLN